MSSVDFDTVANRLYETRKQEIENDEYELTEVDPDLTPIEEMVVDDVSTDEFKLFDNGLARIVFKHHDSVVKFARFGSSDPVFDGKVKNKREVELARQHYDVTVLNHPHDYHEEFLWVEFPYVTPLDETELPDMKQNQALTFATDELDGLEGINPFELRREHIGYNAAEHNVRVIDYGMFEINTTNYSTDRS